MSLDQLPLFAPPAPVAKAVRLPPGPGRDPTFFAILVDAALDDEIRLLVATERRRRGLGGELLAASTRHLSVTGVGYHQELTDADLQLAMVAGDAAAFVRFDLALSRLMSFKPRPHGPAPLVLIPDDAAPLAELERQLRWGMLERGFEPRSLPMTQFHLTLLYDRIQVPKTRLPKPLPLRVEGFALVRSHFGQGRYEILRRWPQG